MVVVFTDASFKETMAIPEAKGGSLQDVANVVMANRIILSVFAPNFEGYDRLSQIEIDLFHRIQPPDDAAHERQRAPAPTRLVTGGDRAILPRASAG